MPSFVVDPQLVSFESIRQGLVNYVSTRSTDAAWKDFYESSTGQVLIELMAGMMTYLQYTAAVGRRETYLAYAQNRSSQVALAETLGYSVYRGRNPVVTLKVTPSTTIALPRLSLLDYPMGTFDQYYLYPAEAVALTAGVQTDIDLVVGTLKTEEIPITTSIATVFRFFSYKVSEDIVVLMGKDPDDFSDLSKYDDDPPSIVEWPLSKYMKDLADSLAVAMTNSAGSVDIFSLNNMDDAYGAEFNTLQLKYIELAQIQFNMSQFLGEATFTYGTIDPNLSSHSMAPFVDRASKDEIRVNTPVYHETAIVVRGRDDYPKLIQQTLSDNFGDCLSVSAQDPNPAEVELSYVLYKDVDQVPTLTALTPTEVIALQEDYIETYRPFGVRPPYIAPIAGINDEETPDVEEARQYAVPDGEGGYIEEYHWVDLTVQIGFYVSRNTLLNVAQASMEEAAQEVLDKYLNILKGVFNLELIEWELEQLSWVKTANVSVVAIRLWDNTTITTPNGIAAALDLSSEWDRFHTMGQGAVVPPYTSNLIVSASYLG